MCPNCSRAYPNKHHLLTHLQNVHQVEMSLDDFDQLLQESGASQDETTQEMKLMFAIDEITNDQ